MAIKKPAKRADKAKNIDKVAAELVKNPLASQREIAKEVGLGNGTVNRAMKEVEQSGALKKDPRIKSLTDADAAIQEGIAKIKQLKITKALEEFEAGNEMNISDSDLNQWDKHSSERRMKLVGEATDEKGGERPYKDMTQADIEERIKKLEG